MCKGSATKDSTQPRKVQEQTRGLQPAAAASSTTAEVVQLESKEKSSDRRHQQTAAAPPPALSAKVSTFVEGTVAGPSTDSAAAVRWVTRTFFWQARRQHAKGGAQSDDTAAGRNVNQSATSSVSTIPSDATEYNVSDLKAVCSSVTLGVASRDGSPTEGPQEVPPSMDIVSMQKLNFEQCLEHISESHYSKSFVSLFWPQILEVQFTSSVAKQSAEADKPAFAILAKLCVVESVGRFAQRCLDKEIDLALADDAKKPQLPAGDWVPVTSVLDFSSRGGDDDQAHVTVPLDDLYFSNDEQLLYHTRSCQFYDPLTRMWFDPDRAEWYDDDEGPSTSSVDNGSSPVLAQ